MSNNIFKCTTIVLMFVHVLLNVAFASEAAANDKVENQPAIKTALAAKSVLLGLHRSQDSVIAVGEHGLVIDNSIENQAWSQQNIPVDKTLTAISQFNNGTLLVVGQEGLILQKKIDKDWQVVFNGYQLIAAKKQRAIKNIELLQQQIEQTIDEDDIDELTMQLEDLEFALEDLDAEVESGPTSPLLDILVVSDKRAFAVGAYNTLLLSEDAGNTWQLVNDRLENVANLHLNSIKKSNNSLYIFGEAGSVYRSNDDGISFEQLYVPYEGTFFGGEAADDFILGYGLKGNIVISFDDGDSWQHKQIESNSTLLGSTLDANGNVWLVGHAGVIVKVSAKNSNMNSVKHPSGNIFSDVIVNDNILTLVGQNGATIWQSGL